jgi:hypothetical protein
MNQLAGEETDLTEAFIIRTKYYHYAHGRSIGLFGVEYNFQEYASSFKMSQSFFVIAQ